MLHGLVPRRLFFAKVSTEGAKKERRAHLRTRGIFRAGDRRSDPCSVFGREDERVTRIAVTDQSSDFQPSMNLPGLAGSQHRQWALSLLLGAL